MRKSDAHSQETRHISVTRIRRLVFTEAISVWVGPRTNRPTQIMWWNEISVQFLNVTRTVHMGLRNPSFSYKTVFSSDVNFPERKSVSPFFSNLFEMSNRDCSLEGEWSRKKKRTLHLLSPLFTPFFSLPPLFLPLPWIQFSAHPLTSFLCLFLSLLLYSLSTELQKRAQRKRSLLASCNKLIEIVRAVAAIRS